MSTRSGLERAVASPGISPDLRAAVEAWQAADPDPATRAELDALVASANVAELRARFAGRLSFGTAGLRAELGAGPMRMNRLVVRQAAAGLAAYLGEHLGHPARLVVGFDARHQSDVFAADTAAVFAATGAVVELFDRHLPTPVLAFAIRYLGADAGVMVTASHNPPRDNGYKVYLGDGAQIVPPADADIAAAIERAAAGPIVLSRIDDPAISRARTGEIVAAYLEAVGALVSPSGPRMLRAVYTPLHGVGHDVFLAAWKAAGFPPPTVVPSQAEPDPDFPTVSFPNPEEPGALDAALAEATKSGADIVLANDPDADRLGVAVRDTSGHRVAVPDTSGHRVAVPDTSGHRVAVPDTGGSAWRQLNGNEIGVLLADHLLRHRPGGRDRLVVTTVVSSRLLGKLAAAHGVNYAETLTGFKWIVRPALAHPEWQFTFGYEEALGFSVGPAVWDKDGISAALVFGELAADLAARGSSPAQRLEELARAFGLHATRQHSFRFAEGTSSAEVMANVRSRLPDAVAGVAIVERRDLLHDDGVSHPTDALLWDLADASRVILRPSGTEPKLKAYLEVIVAVGPAAGDYAQARHIADARLSALEEAVGAVLTEA